VKAFVRQSPSPDWSSFVAAHPRGTLYHDLQWLTALQEAFRCAVFWIECRNSAGGLCGILPLVRQRSIAFGDRLTSVAYCNYGGPLADSDSGRDSLLDAASALAESLGCTVIELRDTVMLGDRWDCRSDKVTFELRLPDTESELSARLGSKLRSQIRRASKEDVHVAHGGMDLVAPFYEVFAENMRDVGTPVYPRRFFQVLARRLGSQLNIIVLRLEGRPTAAALLLRHRDGVEIPWAACTDRGKRVSANMRLYWEALTYSIGVGAATFDFGRCTVDSGPYRFKRQWGAAPRPLYWHVWSPGASARDSRQLGRAGVLASRLWQRLPLPLANALGPVISPSLPW
jgi:FemAB-related protein (PEP-CTERM system-associated)